MVAWRGLGENCAKYLTKGRKVAVSGTLQTRNYEDKQGNKRTAFEVVADDVEFLTPRGEGGAAAPTGAPATRPRRQTMVWTMFPGLLRWTIQHYRSKLD